MGTIRINGKIFEQAAEKTKMKLEEANRQTRRSHVYKKIISIVSILGTLGVSSVAKAESNNSTIAPLPIEAIIPYIIDKLGIHKSVPVDKENMLIWQLNEYVSKNLFTNHDFFGNASVIGVYNVIWHIVLSFLVLIIGKKGLDMVKAQAIGSQSQGSGEFIIRLLASCIMSFFALDIMSIGIYLSNLASGALMKGMGQGTHIFSDAISLAEAGIGTVFWIIGFIIMFAVIAIGYWVRQINLIILGCLAPIANMSWVTDGGSMLGTLVREFIVVLTTPIVQTIVLGIGSVIILEVGTDGNIGILNSVFIGLSTMFVMVVTPSFLRKFVTGSANPLSFALKALLKMKTMPANFIKAMEG